MRHTSSITFTVIFGERCLAKAHSCDYTKNVLRPGSPAPIVYQGSSDVEEKIQR